MQNGSLDARQHSGDTRTPGGIRPITQIPGLNMRIGLHFGSAVGGVIGSGRLRYDLWGMDILTANMMESNGAPGKINVSERFRDILMLNSPKYARSNAAASRTPLTRKSGSLTRPCGATYWARSLSVQRRGERAQ